MKKSLELEYKKQRKRIKQGIKRSEKIGYIVPENILPKIPKKITEKSIKRLQNITPEKIREKSEYIVGEKIVKYKTHKKEVKAEIKKIRRQIKEQPQYIDRIIPFFSYIERFRELVESLPDTRHYYHGRNNPITFSNLNSFKNVLFSILDDRINEIGERAVEKIIADNEDKISDYINGATYDSDQLRVENDLISVANIINGAPLSLEKSTLVSDLSDELIIDI